MSTFFKTIFSAQQRAFAVTCFLTTKSIKQTQKMFNAEYSSGSKRKCKTFFPSKKAIYNWTKDFKKFGTVENKNSKSKYRESNSGRKLSKRTEDNIGIVHDSVEANHKMSIRRRSAMLNIPRESLRLIMKKDLKIKPYIIQVHQRLSRAHKAARVAMCQWILEKLNEDATFHEKIWFSDEAHFFLNGNVNNKKCFFWGSSKPKEVIERGLHDQKVTAWAAMSYRGIIGPYFFEDADGQTLTINSDRYVDVLSKFLERLQEIVPAHMIQEQWFQQDGASPHVSKKSLQWVNTNFDNRRISRRTDCPWSANSPDLNPLDFHLWGFLKDRLCDRVFDNKAQLKEAISVEIENVPTDQCQRVINHFVTRTRKCIELKGGHLEHVI